MSKKQKDTIPYIYIIRWTEQDLWYVGRRTASGCNPNEFWITYWTSSKYVDITRKLYGDPDYMSIRKVFTDNSVEDRIKRCKWWEDRFIEKVDAVKSPRWLNKHKNGHLDATGKSSVFDPLTGKKIWVDTSDEKYLQGYYTHTSVGKVTVFDHELGKNRSVSTNDPDYLSGKLQYFGKGSVTVVDVITKKKFNCKITDPNYLSGRYVYYLNYEENPLRYYWKNLKTQEMIHASIIEMHVLYNLYKSSLQRLVDGETHRVCYWTMADNPVVGDWRTDNQPHTYENVYTGEIVSATKRVMREKYNIASSRLVNGKILIDKGWKLQKTILPEKTLRRIANKSKPPVPPNELRCGNYDDTRYIWESIDGAVVVGNSLDLRRISPELTPSNISSMKRNYLNESEKFVKRWKIVGKVE